MLIDREAEPTLRHWRPRPRRAERTYADATPRRKNAVPRRGIAAGAAVAREHWLSRRVASVNACTEAGAPGTEQKPGATATSSAAPAASAAPPRRRPNRRPSPTSFPPDPQREAVMNSCGSCHNLACSAIGQRSAERWNALEEGHKDKVTERRPGTRCSSTWSQLRRVEARAEGAAAIPRRRMHAVLAGAGCRVLGAGAKCWLVHAGCGCAR